MTKLDKSKRDFFKKAAAGVGLVAAAGYLKNLAPTRGELIQSINEHSEKDVIKQKNAWLKKQWVPMTDSDKKQMLDELLANHNKHTA